MLDLERREKTVETQVLEEEVARVLTEKESLSRTIAEKDALLLSEESKIAQLTSSSEELETTLDKVKMEFQNKLKASEEKQNQMMDEAVSLLNRLCILCLQHISKFYTFLRSW